MNINKIKEQFNIIAQKYDDHRKCFIPCFDDFYKKSVSLLKCYKNNFRNVVDLGAGTGLLTMEIYRLYNNAHYTLVDISNDMLEIAKERFNGLNNFEFIEKNYVENIPVKNCDLICSALSIHHLENKDKIKLYKNIYKTLGDGGCFINLDQFIGISEKINNLYNEWWYNFIDNSGINAEEKTAWIERKKLDNENTIKETMELLKGSGFGNIECIYNFMKFGVIMAIK
ncbi:MAG: class I SAM-dependent methyltransferase [Spirochaetaceae bacterium]|jgi:ubiquinone/menaquinone biosynthesis C-methylase UbiE|nr:class I SAM-dependent methyltransferase [Spirochaetaceae bacterium]